MKGEKNMTKENIEKFISDFNTYAGFDISGKLEADNPNVAEAFINRIEKQIELKISKHCPKYMYIKNQLTEKQKQAIWDAMLEQTLFVLTTGDVTLMNGFDPVTNQMIDLTALRKRDLSPIAREILTAAGLFYRGITSRRASGYEYERSHWR
jgi:hypothetical protein